jgi:hypothetical protein
LNPIDESLKALSHPRAVVSVESRVMAAIRAEAGRRKAPLRPRQQGVLAAAALAVVAAETAIWTAALSGLPWNDAAGFGHGLLKALFVALELVTILEHSIGALVRAIGLVVSTPAVQAASAGSVLVFVLILVAARTRRAATVRGVQ